MRKTLALLTLLCFAVDASATEWHILGARAMGMGGAGTALAQGPIGAYWNPAGLDQKENASGVELPFSGHAAITGGFLQGANDLNQISQACQASGGAPTGNCSQANINGAIAKLNQSNNGVRADFGGGLGVKIGKIAVFANDFIYAGGKPVSDLNPNNITPAGIKNNQSKMILNGINVVEIGAGYGHELPFLHGVSAGGNLKAMIGRVGYQQIVFASNNSGSSGSFGKFRDNTTSSFQPGLDLGLLWDLSRTWEKMPMRPRFALVARNVNDPKFIEPALAKANGTPNRFSLQGNTRAGFALSPLHFLNLTADIDLTKNLTAVDGVKSQMMGAGAEVNVFNRAWINIPLRAGLSRNLADSGSKTLLSLGGGVHLFHFNLDLAVNWSPAKQTTQTIGQNKTFPTEFGGAVQLGLLFGGSNG